jgi:FdhE protein
VQRILDPAQIESLTSHSVPRLVLPVRERLFAARAARLRSLAAHDSLGGYLGFAAALAAAQQAAAETLVLPAPDPAAVELARAHGMPSVPARGHRRSPEWRVALGRIATAVAADERFPAAVGATCVRLAALPPAALEAHAERLLAADDGRDADPAAAPFLVAALQVYFGALAAGLRPEDVAIAEHARTCPACGSLPVASVVRAGAPYSGYRYLHCGLCATEWHRVRVECTQCDSNQGIAYQSIEGGSAAIRAETCDACRGYRKIFYQEHDGEVEPLADDLGSVALDLLLTDAGFHRASANPLLWQPAA